MNAPSSLSTVPPEAIRLALVALSSEEFEEWIQSLGIQKEDALRLIYEVEEREQ